MIAHGSHATEESINTTCERIEEKPICVVDVYYDDKYFSATIENVFMLKRTVDKYDKFIVFAHHKKESKEFENEQDMIKYVSDMFKIRFATKVQSFFQIEAQRCIFVCHDFSSHPVFGYLQLNKPDVYARMISEDDLIEDFSIVEPMPEAIDLSLTEYERLIFDQKYINSLKEFRSTHKQLK
jgi:hypothetical protein